MHQLNIVYVAMLNNMWDIENQLTVLLPKIIDKASDTSLKKELTAHLEETLDHKVQLEELIAHHSQTLTYERDMAFETMLQDATSDLSFIDHAAVKDAFMIASVQTIEHVKMSRYQTLLQWAHELKDEYGAGVLSTALSEEKSMSKKLTQIAEGSPLNVGINQKAAADDAA